jgi:O-antigen ligase
MQWLRVPVIVGAAVIVGLLAGVEPKLAIAASIGCGFLVLAFADLTAATAVFGFLSFIEVVPLGGSIVNVTKLAGLVLALSWFAFLTTRERSAGDFFAAFPLISSLLLLFLSWSLLSVLWSESQGVAIASVGRYALNAVLFLIVFAAIREPKHAKGLAIAFLAGAVTAAAYGLVTPASEEELGRLSSSVLDPNQLASVLVAGLPLAATLALMARKAPLARLAAVGAGLFCLLSLCLTVSRGGLIALAASLAAAAILGGRWRLPIIAMAIVTISVTVGYFAVLAPESALERITQTTRGESEVTEGRTTIWQVAWRAFEAHPVRGVGAGNFQEAAPHYLLQPGSLGRTDTIIDQPLATHNTYLQILAEEGIVGLALFLSVIVFCLGSVIRAATLFKRRSDRDMEALARALAVALIGTVVADFFLSQEFSKQLWLLMGICPAMLAIAQLSSSGSMKADLNPVSLPRPSASYLGVP